LACYLRRLLIQPISIMPLAAPTRIKCGWLCRVCDEIVKVGVFCRCFMNGGFPRMPIRQLRKLLSIMGSIGIKFQSWLIRGMNNGAILMNRKTYRHNPVGGFGVKIGSNLVYKPAERGQIPCVHVGMPRGWNG